MLRTSITRFCEDLNKISLRIKGRTVYVFLCLFAITRTKTLNFDFACFRRSQIRQTLKKKAFEDAGIPVKQVSAQSKATPQQTTSTVVAQSQPQPQQPSLQPPQQQSPQPTNDVVQQQQQATEIKQETGDQAGLMNKSAEMMMTLNRLNTQESEVDVEGLATSEVKMEFETGPEEMAG